MFYGVLRVLYIFWIIVLSHLFFLFLSLLLSLTVIFVSL